MPSNCHQLFGDPGLVRVDDILCQKGNTPQINLIDVANAVSDRSKYTLMMMTNVDWNNDGFALGSNTVELNWNDRKSPVISRLSAKLLRNSTCNAKCY